MTLQQKMLYVWTRKTTLLTFAATAVQGMIADPQLIDPATHRTLIAWLHWFLGLLTAYGITALGFMSLPREPWTNDDRIRNNLAPIPSLAPPTIPIPTGLTPAQGVQRNEPTEK